MKKSTKILIISAAILIIALIVFYPYIKAEYLTVKYGDEFNGLEQQTKMMDPASYHKVIEYSKSHATVFYVLSGKGGCVIVFEKENNNWEIVTWEMIWSHYGSADEFYWPYYR